MREPTYPKEGFFAFRSKTNPDECPVAVYLEVGLNIEDLYDQITEEEYNAIQKEIEARTQDIEMYNEEYNGGDST